MQLQRKTLTALAIGSALLSSFPAKADLTVGVIVSATGPAASVGVTQQRTVQILPREFGGEKVNWILLDDASDTTTAVKHARKLIGEDKVDIIVGPSLTPNSLALLDQLSETGTPMLSLAGSGAIVEPVDEKRRWAFKTPQSDGQMAQAIVQHMASHGVRSVGFISFNDAYGEGWAKSLGALAERNGIKIVASERFQRTDTSVTGQILRLIGANPDAVFVAASGTPAVLPQATLAERGFKKPVYQTHGIANNDFLRVGGKNVEGTLLPAGPVLVAEQLPDSHPAKAPALEFVRLYEALPNAGMRSTFAAYLWDAALILKAAVPNALKTAKPGTSEFRKALRDSIEEVKDVVATNGVYTMSPTDHLGLDERSRVMVRIESGTWRLVR
ncbi:ABC transporter substrate-binding protein [Azospirillum sp. TSA6c]|uniref:ABC transporter substrate-binding protein n=1 Tax=unclassified Azospirillum TaxID=2630922 RepID=UPI000D603CE4|nr:ABC transporter substrate-binding protein [Azospirillum sp. TSA6c]PWC47361.1 branched-chain amino acid ABC transporter substrate-binding protein [Azospirillum sp. TSA6c]